MNRLELALGVALKLAYTNEPAQNGHSSIYSWELLDQNDFLAFNFSFRLTFANTTTRKVWYRSVTLINHNPLHSAFDHLGKLLALHLFSFASACLLGTNNQLDHIFGLDLLSGFPSICRYCFKTPISSFTLPVCESILIITTVFLFLGEMLTRLHLVQLVENADRLTDVSGWFAMSAILALTNLYAAGIALGFGCSLHRLSTCSVPGMQVVLVLVVAFGVGSKAFCRLVMTADMLNQHDLDLGLFSILQLSSQTTSLLTPGSSFTDCQLFLILLSHALTLDSLQLVQ